MKSVVYKLKNPKDGVEELVLYAPTRKNMKFAMAVKSAFMQVAIAEAAKEKAKEAELKAKLSDEELILWEERKKQKEKEEEEEQEEKITGKSMVFVLFTNKEIDFGDLIDRFASACTSSTMCQMNGGNVPKDFIDDLIMEDIEGLFSEFMGNFITI